MTVLKIDKKKDIHTIVSNLMRGDEFYKAYERFIFEDREHKLISWLRRTWNGAYASYFNKTRNFLSVLLSPFVNPGFSYAFANKKLSILDIGCSTGLFLSMLDKKLWETYGVEINKSAGALAIKNGVRLFPGNFEKIKIDKKFDVVRASHVIEHVADVDKFMEKVKQLTLKNGLIVISTPNLKSFSRAVFQDNWSGYYDDTHQHILSEKKIIQLAHKHGLETITAKSYFMGYFGDSLTRTLHIRNPKILNVLFKLAYILYLPISLVENVFKNGDALFIVLRRP
ncbi:MAG: class I SAM-dependent methyltransferase [Patescibacteria group bacterium]|jgi:2-polyprenyl-3-methyl-5-hydroxy-6-metoxy-1,4-benzoquinol methylase